MTIDSRNRDRSVVEELPRRRDKEETRGKVVDAARSLFAREGFQRVTIRMIAEEAGVATGSVFITFTSKDELCDEIIIEYLTELAGRVSIAAAQSAGKPVQARLALIGESLLADPPERLPFIRETIATSWTRTECAERKVRAASVPIHDAIIAVLSEARAAGELHAKLDCALAEDMFTSVMFSNLKVVLYEGASPAQIRQRMAGQIQMLLDGWRAARG